MSSRAFKISLILFQVLCINELAAIVWARPVTLSSVSRTEKAGRGYFGRRGAASRSTRLVESEAISCTDGEVVAVTAAAKKTAAQSVTLNAFDLCLCGAFATAFGDFVMHPVDTIKVTQQAAVLAVDIITTASSSPLSSLSPPPSLPSLPPLHLLPSTSR